MPRWCLGWDVLCWLGHRRFARQWSGPQLRLELKDTHQIALSPDTLEHYMGLYQTLLAARPQDPDRLAEASQDIASLVLTIDGLQPAKGHETFYVVRARTSKRVWCAEPLLASAEPEVRRVIVLACQWAERLAKPVRVWMSEKQDAFVKAIAEEFSGPPHRYCHNHCMRDVAKPVLEMDRRAKVTMRRKVRGLRAIERRVLEARRTTTAAEPTAPPERSKTADRPRANPPAVAAPPLAVPPEPCVSSDRGVLRPDGALDATGLRGAREAAVEDEVGEVVLGSGAAVRGILNDSQGGPLHPPGVRMREALQDVRDSLDRSLQGKKGGLQRRC
jgi:hypothetical protein